MDGGGMAHLDGGRQLWKQDSVDDNFSAALRHSLLPPSSALGCGSRRFLNMAGEGKPPKVDAMKCYMMGPHRIGVARPLYWPHDSLDGREVLQIATGRNHMAAIVAPKAKG